jgi:hypothetical protein
MSYMRCFQDIRRAAKWMVAYEHAYTFLRVDRAAHWASYPLVQFTDCGDAAVRVRPRSLPIAIPAESGPGQITQGRNEAYLLRLGPVRRHRDSHRREFLTVHGFLC